MSQKAPSFSFHSLKDWRDYLAQSGLDIPFCDDLSSLAQPWTIGTKTAPNRILYQPMEGCDGTPDGRPGELTLRRYQRFAAGGAGVIWVEAIAVCEEGRANPRQLWIHENNLDSFRELIHGIKETGRKAHGAEPVVILQLTHSGRYSKPHGTPAPLIAYNNPIFEKDQPIDASRILTDDDLKRLETLYEKAAHLAEQAGADGVDIKSCHRYLLCELLSAYERAGEYGGSFENRTRLLRNAVAAATAATQRVFVTSRLNLYDGFPHPYGFGVRPGEGIDPDYAEGIELCRILHEKHRVPLIDVTIGNPYFNPHVNRPANTKLNLEIEPPLKGVERILGASTALKKAIPSLGVVCSGLTYLRQFVPYTAAAMLWEGRCDLVGLGRATFAYPHIAADMVAGKELKETDCCIACGKCTELMRAGTVAGCVIRDKEAYLPYYQKYVLKKEI